MTRNYGLKPRNSVYIPPPPPRRHWLGAFEFLGGIVALAIIMAAGFAAAFIIHAIVGG